MPEGEADKKETSLYVGRRENPQIGNVRAFIQDSGATRDSIRPEDAKPISGLKGSVTTSNGKIPAVYSHQTKQCPFPEEAAERGPALVLDGSVVRTLLALSARLVGVDRALFALRVCCVVLHFLRLRSR